MGKKKFLSAAIFGKRKSFQGSRRQFFRGGLPLKLVAAGILPAVEAWHPARRKWREFQVRFQMGGSFRAARCQPLPFRRAHYIRRRTPEALRKVIVSLIR